ncbi:hypothetical protein LK538_24835, partial [Serratia marcescens]|uniref:hypothetical protein n=1 Tax=Serratia marcescens TaxID=615 RepID=UPI001D15350C
QDEFFLTHMREAICSYAPKKRCTRAEKGALSALKERCITKAPRWRSQNDAQPFLFDAFKRIEQWKASIKSCASDSLSASL